jgi:hypothetical protein
MVVPKVSQNVLGTPPTGAWRGGRVSPDSKITRGAELAMRIGEESAHRAPTQYVQEVKNKVSDTCDELIRIGARIRPLLVDGESLGWVRGLHDTERRDLRRWFPKSQDFILRSLLLTTTLTEEELGQLTSLEVSRLVKLVIVMGDRDASLYPYLAAFSTTRESERLWHSGGSCASFENKVIPMPDGRKVTIMCPSDHARLWASLCTYREQAKKRLDESWNAVLIMRPWAGKSVDGLAAELKAATKAMQAGVMDPWEHMVAAAPEKALDDGWAHLENMETKEGMLKELYGMLGNDRHEQLMAKFEHQQLEAADKRKKDIEQIVAKRGGPGINKETIRIMSDDDMRLQDAKMRGRRMPPPPARREQEGGRPDYAEKIKKYQ